MGCRHPAGAARCPPDCGGPCLRVLARLQAVVHEMGHNMFQGHSGQFNDKGVFDE